MNETLSSPNIRGGVMVREAMAEPKLSSPYIRGGVMGREAMAEPNLGST
jgi:hypothetical protein